MTTRTEKIAAIEAELAVLKAVDDSFTPDELLVLFDCGEV